MLSIETEARIVKILLTLSENEKSIEISRQLLREDNDFDSYQIFRYLDKGSKNKIDSYDIINFLRKRRIKVNELEVNFFILSYDEVSNNYLSYIEFLNFLQCDNSFKKNNFSKNETISQSIEFELGKLLEKEILLSRNLFPLLNDLKTRLDYNIHNFYHSIKKMNNITFDCIKKFLEKNYVNFSNIDIKNIIKRLDFNKDGRIDLCEFHKFFGFPEFSKLCPSKLCCICGCCNCCCEGPCCKKNCENDIVENEYFDNGNSNYKQYISNFENNQNENFKNEKKDIINNNNFVKNKEINNNNNENNNINLKKNNVFYNENKLNLGRKNNENLNLSNKDFDKGNNNKNNSIIGKYSKILLPEIIYQAIKKNKKPIEEIKNNSFKNEYNNSYKVTNFATNQTPERDNHFNKNSINSSPLTKSQLINSINNNFNNINLKDNNNNDTNRIININNNNININISDMNNTNIQNNQNLIEENQMKEYIIELMKIESKIEEEKIELVSKCDFNIEDAFKIFDLNNKGYIIDDDLKFTLNQFGIFANDHDIRLLMKRFDLNKKSCLTFTDFFDMIVPFEKDYRILIENRDSNIFSDNYSIYDIFMFSTKNLIKNLFIDLIEYENKLNNIKKNFTTLRLKLKDLFNLINTNLSNEFNFDDLEKYLKKNCILNNLKDANLLFIRFDKNRDGKIDYCEFEEEFQPQF